MSFCVLRKQIYYLYAWLNYLSKMFILRKIIDVTNSKLPYRNILSPIITYIGNFPASPNYIVFGSVSMNRMCSADRQRKAERSERQRRR